MAGIGRVPPDALTAHTGAVAPTPAQDLIDRGEKIFTLCSP
jgi:hypothetical protein